MQQHIFPSRKSNMVWGGGDKPGPPAVLERPWLDIWHCSSARDLFCGFLWSSEGLRVPSEIWFPFRFLCPWMTFWKAMSKEKLEAKSPVELVNGARCRDHPFICFEVTSYVFTCSVSWQVSIWWLAWALCVQGACWGGRGAFIATCRSRGASLCAEGLDLMEEWKARHVRSGWLVWTCLEWSSDLVEVEWNNWQDPRRRTSRVP